ncbi:hypothetical protein GUJ93_ZPchr0010g7927 [Zizania palustris]|uniref:Uncharacterized protein n=1 Tax=Zizania palustris TaxID=103762 RepID=A0A8J5W738_ZIZPA|nr:hypothetical protein GUJ93_ZPchr0010g7927 [Zizania palustris]
MDSRRRCWRQCSSSRAAASPTCDDVCSGFSHGALHHDLGLSVVLHLRYVDALLASTRSGEFALIYDHGASRTTGLVSP